MKGKAIEKIRWEKKDKRTIGIWEAKMLKTMEERKRRIRVIGNEGKWKKRKKGE